MFTLGVLQKVYTVAPHTLLLGKTFQHLVYIERERCQLHVHWLGQTPIATDEYVQYSESAAAQCGILYMVAGILYDVCIYTGFLLSTTWYNLNTIIEICYNNSQLSIHLSHAHLLISNFCSLVLVPEKNCVRRVSNSLRTPASAWHGEREREKGEPGNPGGKAFPQPHYLP